jgi:2-succinyl-5-enolpyruvyl-6-hydroxy-3-cyclohexene-1-carboxylate synthase
VAAPPETCVAPLVSGLVASDTASPVASAADGAPSATAYRRLLERLDATAAAVLRARVDRATDRDPDGLSEAWVTRRLVAMLPSDHALFAGNSLPIRHLDGLAEPRAEPLASFANRGASGIDGILASAAGMVRGRRGPGVLLVGDLSLLHDLSSLWLLVRLAEKLIVVVLNNGGGGIFSLLPIVRHPSVLTPWVDAAHNLRLAGLAGELGVPSWRAETRRGFEETWQAALASPRSCLIEVVCPRHQHAALLEELRHEIARRVGARPAPSDDGPHRPQPSMHEKEVSR